MTPPDYPIVTTHPAAQCWGKAAFQTPQLAVRVEKRLKTARRGRKEKPATAYRCPHCGMFHLGRLP